MPGHSPRRLDAGEDGKKRDSAGADDSPRDAPVTDDWDWPLLWEIGLQDLGLTDDFFWDLTFREFDALVERRRSIDQRQEYHAALICSVVANFNQFGDRRKVFQPADFMASPVKKAATKQKLDDGMDVLSRFDAFATLCGINNQGELEARERIAREKAEAEAALNPAALNPNPEKP